MPKVTVVIPTYNHADHLSAAIQSLSSQTFQDFEVIIVDDGSTDRTREVVERYKSQNIRYFFQNNQGQSSARNLGIRNAEGDYIALMDSDDVYKCNKLEQQVRYLESNPECVFVYSDFEYILNGRLCHGRYLKDKGLLHLTQSQNLFEEVLNLRNFFIYPSTVLLRKSIFDAVGLFDERFRFGEDWDLWLRILKVFPRMDFLDEVLIERYIHTSNISMDKERIYNHLICLKTEYLERKNFLTSQQKMIIRREVVSHYYELGCFYLTQSQYPQACFNFQKAIKSRFFPRIMMYCAKAMILQKKKALFEKD